MMKVRTIFFIAGLFFCCACAKEAQVSNDTTVLSPSEEATGRDLPGEDGQTDGQGASDGRMTLTVSLPEALTRISLTQDEDNADGVVKVAWEETDKLYINGAEFTIDTPLNENRRIATFTGPAVTAPYTILYGASTVEAANALILAEQTQDGNTSTAHLPYVAMLTDVNTLEDVCFTPNWASANGATLKQTGILRLRLKLPDTVSSVDSLTVTAPSPVFYTSNACSATTNTLKILFSPAATPTDQVINAYLMLPWSDVSIAASTNLTITAVTSDHDVYHRTEDAGGKTLSMGKVNAIKLTCDAPGTNVTLDDFAGGSGVEGDPYLIGNQRQMRRMDANMTAGQITWFKLIDDITMSNASWTALNNTPDESSVYSKYIHFDGNNKTVRNLHSSGAYASLFGVLNGTVQDLTIDSAVITPGSSKCGVLAGFIGSGGTQAVSVSGITISNSQVGTSAVPGTSYCGILAAQASRAGTSISGITLTDSQVYGASGVGGVLAYVAAGTTLSGITVSGCTVHTSTTTTSTSGANNNHSAGGLIGRNDASLTVSGTNRVENTDVTGYHTVGGAIGFINSVANMSGITFCGNGTKGIITGNKQYLGGIAGSASGSGTVISDCHVEYATIDAASITNDSRAGGFAGQVNNDVTVKGCSVGTSGRTVTVRLGTPAENNNKLNSGGFVGTHYGTITKNGDTRTTAYATVTCTNPNTGYQLNVGGFGGYVRGTIEYADADVTMTGLKGTYIGGFAGYATLQADTTPCVIDHCTLSGTVSGNNYTGGFVGYVDSNTPLLSNNRASGTVSGNRYTGGFAGFVKTGSIQKCSSTSAVNCTDYSGGFIGNIDGNATISDCYAGGNISANNNQQRLGGLIGQIVNTTASITNCYASGTVAGGFCLGGLIGRIEGSNVSVSHCAAWNNSVTAYSTTTDKWSSGAVVGVAFPSCTLTDNYRKPDMALKAYWGNVTGYTYLLDADYQHANVSPSHKLVICVIGTGEKRETTATGLGSNQDGYPIWPYHGKVDSGKTLSQLASGTLGWSSDTWDFTGDLPVLR